MTIIIMFLLLLLLPLLDPFHLHVVSFYLIISLICLQFFIMFPNHHALCHCRNIVVESSSHHYLQEFSEVVKGLKLTETLSTAVEGYLE